MSKRTENREMEDEEMVRMTEPDVEESYDEEEGWLESEPQPHPHSSEEEEELPPRPRSRFLAPLPIALIAVLIGAAGFLGGVLVQKGGGEGGFAAAIPGGGEFPSFLAGKSGEGSESEGGSGIPAGFPGGGSGAAVSGTVSSVKGRTIYVEESEGNVVAVKAQGGSTVSRDSDVSVKKIHPGDSVVVQGSTHGSTVKASSIAATEAGLESSVAGELPAAAEGSSVELFGE